MADGQIFEEPRKGWLERLTGALACGRPRTVRRREQLSLTVPAARAGAVQSAIEQWLRGHGVAAALVATDAGDGKTRLRAKLDEAEAAKLDLSADAVQAELQAVLEAAIH
ncbi:MAG TPA: hypothetical protein VGP69_03560 [Gaiellaceae bacterium]|jgi:multidrug efflux pump subunit AcrB|nr:hypothetical protein [Gaiellaceae bacterium]